MNKRSIGSYGEELAVRFLTENGLIILDRNFNSRHGELDIVALDNDTYVFVEVKYRKEDGDYDPLLAITPLKRKSIVRTARGYLYCKHISEYTPVRFDCIGIMGTEINWVKNAFEAY